jgi:hypothetical protein
MLKYLSMARNLISKSRAQDGLSVSVPALIVIAALVIGFLSPAYADAHHVWQKVEITLNAGKSYDNPYTDVEVWVDLRGPGFNKRCYGFWDGGSTFRVRMLGTAPGTWTWRSGSNQRDSGLNDKIGTFIATAWSEADKKENRVRKRSCFSIRRWDALFPSG